MKHDFSTAFPTTLLLGALLVPGFLSGCANGRPMSFGDRQTIAPPATNSYLSQPGVPTNPGGPANPGAPTNPPPFIPSNAPMPSGSIGGTGVSGGSSNPNGAVTFQTAGVAPPVAALASTAPVSPGLGWSTVADQELTARPTGQTAFQNLEARSHSITRTTDEGRTITVAADPNAPTVSSSQIITQISANE